MGSAYAEMGNYAEAKRCYQEALAIDRTLDNPLEVASDLLNLAQLYMETGELSQALAHTNEARQLHQDGGCEQGVLEATAVLALIYRLLGDAPQAIAHMQQALALAQKLGHRHQEATIWNNFSMLHKDRGTWEEAAACQAKALELYRAVGDRDGQAASLLNLGMIANRMGQPEEGLQLLQLATQIDREIGSQEGELLCQAQTAVILREQGKVDEALALQNEALAAAVQLNNPDHIWRVYLGRAGTYTELGAFTEAEADLHQAIRTIESLRVGLGHRHLKETFFGADKVSVYRRLVLLLVRQRQKMADALVMVERTRSRLLLDELATTPIQTAKQDAKALIEQERQLLDLLQSIRRQVETGQLTQKLEDERQHHSEALEQIWAQISDLSPQYVSLRRGDLFEYSEFRTLLTGS
jgi:tetratricopeptide (TPR) repeat protein